MQGTDSGNSFLATYRSCRRKFYYAYEEAIEPQARGSALSIGTAVHAGLAQWYKTHDLGKSADAALASLAVDSVNHDNLVEAESDLVAVTTSLLEGYFAKYPTEPFTVVETELPFTVVLTVDGEDFTYTGRIDLLVRWNTGQYFVLEHKTTSLSPPVFLKTFPLDAQITGYVFGARRMTNMPIAGAVVNVLSKTKSKKEPTLHSYDREVFLRHDSDLAAWEAETLETIRDLRRTRLRSKELGLAAWYMNTTQCVPAPGRECEFRNLCLFPTAAVKATYYQQKEVGV